MIAQGLEDNGAIVYVLGRREDKIREVASTAVSGTVLHIRSQGLR